MQRSFYIRDLVETDKELQRARTRRLNRGKGAVCSLNKKIHCTVRAIRKTKNKKSIDFKKKKGSLRSPRGRLVASLKNPRHSSIARLRKNKFIQYFHMYI